MKVPPIVIGVAAGLLAFLVAGLASNITKPVKALKEPLAQSQAQQK